LFKRSEQGFKGVIWLFNHTAILQAIIMGSGKELIKMISHNSYSKVCLLVNSIMFYEIGMPDLSWNFLFFFG